MFEIHKRHSPMFAMSEIRLCAQILTDTLQFNELIRPGIEVLDISETVRINENNEFIVKSTLRFEEVQSALGEHPAIKRLRRMQASQLIEEMLNNIVARLGVDSYICMGGHPSIPPIGKTLREATRNSQKPLMVFTATEGASLPVVEPKWYGMDHPALWIGKQWLSEMDETEAFVAMSPELKLEVGLNRYQSLEILGDFSVGLVRL